MSDAKPKLQVNFKGGIPDLVNIYADNDGELFDLLGALDTDRVRDAIIAAGQSIQQAQAAITVVHNIPGSAVVGHSNVVPMQQPAAAAPAAGPSCIHGPKKFANGVAKSGKNAGKAWEAWDCPNKLCPREWVND